MSWGRWCGCCSARCSPTASGPPRWGWPRPGQWAANWLITVTFPGLREHLGLAYGFYALCAVLSFLFVWQWVEETKGVSPGGHARRGARTDEAARGH